MNNIQFSKDYLIKFDKSQPKLQQFTIQINKPDKLTQVVADFIITFGKKPLIIKAKNSIAGFKIRKNMDIGLKLQYTGYRDCYTFIN
jgi:ribosomal protein L5